MAQLRHRPAAPALRLTTWLADADHEYIEAVPNPEEAGFLSRSAVCEDANPRVNADDPTVSLMHNLSLSPTRSLHSRPTQSDQYVGSDQPPTHHHALNTPESSRSWMFTPATSMCSTPPFWADALPKEPMKLTFGVEIEHLFIYNQIPGLQWQWMFDAPLKNHAETGRGKGWSSVGEGCEAPWGKQGQWDDRSAADFHDHIDEDMEIFSCSRHIREPMEIQQRVLERSNLDCVIGRSTGAKWCLTSVSVNPTNLA